MTGGRTGRRWSIYKSAEENRLRQKNKYSKILISSTPIACSMSEISLGMWWTIRCQRYIYMHPHYAHTCRKPSTLFWHIIATPMKNAWICFKGVPAGFYFVDSPYIAPAHVLHVLSLTSLGSYLFVPLTSSVTRLFCRQFWTWLLSMRGGSYLK